MRNFILLLCLWVVGCVLDVNVYVIMEEVDMRGLQFYSRLSCVPRVEIYYPSTSNVPSHFRLHSQPLHVDFGESNSTWLIINGNNHQVSCEEIDTLYVEYGRVERRGIVGADVSAFGYSFSEKDNRFQVGVGSSMFAFFCFDLLFVKAHYLQLYNYAMKETITSIVHALNPATWAHHSILFTTTILLYYPDLPFQTILTQYPHPYLHAQAHTSAMNRIYGLIGFNPLALRQKEHTGSAWGMEIVMRHKKELVEIMMGGRQTTTHTIKQIVNTPTSLLVHVRPKTPPPAPSSTSHIWLDVLGVVCILGAIVHIQSSSTRKYQNIPTSE